MEENASNALLMAGGILIGILIISLGVIIFQASAQFARNYEIEREQIELTSFNSQFEKYNKKDLTFQDIVTVANLAREINLKNGIERDETYSTENKNLAIHINLSFPDLPTIHMETKSNDDLIDMLNDTEGKHYVMGTDNNVNKYRCKIKGGVVYDDGEKVHIMNFEKVD